MRRASGRLTVSLVLMLLGLLVVAQLQSQATAPALAGLSAQDLTVLVANLTTRNNELRDEISSLQVQRASVAAAVQRGDTSAVQIRSDLSRIEAWSGVLPVTGAGVRVLIAGSIPGRLARAAAGKPVNSSARAAT